MNSEPTQAPGCLHPGIAEPEAVTSSLCQALRKTALSNRRLIAPRHLDKAGCEETVSFLRFLETGDEKAARERGRQLALNGLGIRSMVAMTAALWRACQESVNSGEEAAGNYSAPLLEGYMEGREEELLRAQELTMQAYVRARERQIGSQEQ